MPSSPDGGRTLTRNWLRFGQVLRGLGFDAGPARMLPYLRALTLLDQRRFDDLAAAVHAHFARRRDDFAVLDRALRTFLAGAEEQEGRPAAGEPSAGVDESDGDSRGAVTISRQLTILDEPDETEPPLTIATYSATEVLRHKDFDAMSDDEMHAVRRLIRQMATPAGRRRSRRYQRGGDERLDLRRVLRDSLRFNGEPLLFAWRRRRWKPRPLVLLCDISGSMERYTRLLLHFVYAMEHASERVEAFVFATRLTRITRQLRTHDADRALDRVMDSVEDWSGGTRIGDAIDEFNRRYGRRVLGHGATAVVISDGWDRGDAAVLAQATLRLQRSCHRLIWMNPLMGAPGFEPLTLGLRAVLPYVDDFISAHNLVSLEQLQDLLENLDDRRQVRRQSLQPV
jgi:uncharacterized protein with von Willebrand factor type A (vWA) domain